MRLIDADDFANRMIKQWDTANDEKKAEIVAVIANIVTPILVGTPTIDAEPVVRCKDCKHFDMRSMECQNDRVSTDHEGGASYSLNFYLEDYCSFGERKMDEEVQHAEERSDS